MADQDFSVWKDRYDALDSAISNFEKSLLNGARFSSRDQLKQKINELKEFAKESEEAEAPNASQQELIVLQEIQNIANLVTCLKVFAKDQFAFFYNGFSADNISPEKLIGSRKNELKLSREFPSEYVFSVTLYQIAEDLEVIRRVASQRLSQDTGLDLRTADQLAWNALQPMITAGLLPPYENGLSPTVMTYFQKSASIRMIPYAPVALIGVPFSAQSVGRDYLAIPHEVGHYVYRHGRLKGQPIPQVLGKKLLELPEPSPRYVQRWKEEIFADVYGCLVGGPVVALSFRDLALQSSRVTLVQTPGEYLYGQLTEDDGVHPTAVLRPYLYTKVLGKMNVSLAMELEEAWTNEIGQITQFIRPPDEEDTGSELPETGKAEDKDEAKRKQDKRIRKGTKFRSRYTGAGVAYIDIEESKREMDRVVEVILELLEFSPKQKRPTWSDNLPTGDPERQSLQEREKLLYDEFDKNGISAAISKVQENPPRLELPSSLEDVWKNWVKRENFFPGFGETPKDENGNFIPIEAGRAERLEALEQEPRYTWNHVFWAGGWNTRANGTSGGNGILSPRNWRGQSDGGGAGTY